MGGINRVSALEVEKRLPCNETSGEGMRQCEDVRREMYVSKIVGKECVLMKEGYQRKN